ncbi:MAG: hypothetical protein B6U94_01585 [Thermofilum sp. ex4484_79]|nr:MAG: hypothetical protein B6U94_01585 [Thermofilum sp. ex4484_79]
MLRCIRQIIGVAYLQLVLVRRQPTWLLQGFVSAIGFTMILYVWGSLDALKNLVIAYIITGAWGLGLNIVAQTIGWDKINHSLEYYVASPVTLPIYFMGTILGSSPFLIPNIIPAIVVAMLFKMDLFPLVMLIPLSFIALLLGAFLSLSIILRIKNRTNISAITNPLYTLTITLPPIYYPLYALPLPLRWIALIIPSVPIMEIARWVTGYAAIACNPLLSLASLTAWMISMTLIITKKFKWGLN